MGTKARRLAFMTLGWLGCFLLPVGVALVSWAFAYDRLPSEDDYSPWPVYVIDSLCWADLLFTATVIWAARWWWWLAALVAVPLLILTVVLAAFGGLWIEGTYF
jgi:hypothetical protein